RILALTGALLVVLVCLVPLPYLAFFAWVMPDPRHQSFWVQYGEELLAGMGTCVLLFGTICGTAYCVFYYGRAQRNELAAARLSDQLSRARLEVLRSQLNPHFLFNALNSIAMLARTGAQRE